MLDPLSALTVMALALAALPAGLFVANLWCYRPPPEPPVSAGTSGDGPRLPPVSVLIPARDEERVIGAAVRSVLASEDVQGRPLDLELLVLDDGSRDATADIVVGLAEDDPRVRLETAPPLPAGWCGKQHACAVLAGHARHPVLVFLDADVRLAPDALRRIVAFLEHSSAGLVSGFPRQETGTWAEKLLIPLIHFVLLGYLPMGIMRRSSKPGYGAACGQLVAVRADAYREVGGHRAIRASLHDGLHLPRRFRRGRYRTDLFDATELAVCRMYENARGVFAGLAKNAHEGIGALSTIPLWTVLLLGGQVLPFVLLAAGGLGGVPGAATAAASGAASLAWGTRFLAAWRFRQSWLGALLHPLGVFLLLAIQWWALTRHLLGRPASWKGRSYPARSTDQRTDAPQRT